jgi:dihydropteridine reductase
MKSKLGLIVGGSGALGRNVVSVFKKHGWRLLNVDIRSNEEADVNITLKSESISSQLRAIHD